MQPPQVVVHAVLDPGRRCSRCSSSARSPAASTCAKTSASTPRSDQLRRRHPDRRLRVTVTGPDGVSVGVRGVAPQAVDYHTGRYLLTCRPRRSVDLSRFGPARDTRCASVTPDGTVVTGTTVIPTCHRHSSPDSRLDAVQPRPRLAAAHLGGRRRRAQLPSARRSRPSARSSCSPTRRRHAARRPAELLRRRASSACSFPVSASASRVAAVDSTTSTTIARGTIRSPAPAIINRLQGGIGLFGAAVSISRPHASTSCRTAASRRSRGVGRRAAITARAASSTRAHLRRDAGRARGAQRLVRARPRERALEGWWARASTGASCWSSSPIRSAVDTVAVFSGEQRGDSLVGDVRQCRGPGRLA